MHKVTLDHVATKDKLEHTEQYKMVVELGNRIIPPDMVHEVLLNIRDADSEFRQNFTKSVLTFIWQGKYKANDKIVEYIEHECVCHADLFRNVFFGNTEFNLSADIDLLPAAWQLEKRMQLLSILANNIDLEDQDVHFDIRQESDYTMVLAMQAHLLSNREKVQNSDTPENDMTHYCSFSMIMAAQHTDNLLSLKDKIDQRQRSNPALSVYFEQQINLCSKTVSEASKTNDLSPS